MQSAHVAHGRPSWYKDAKWVAAILLFLVLGPALFLYNLSEITDERPAVDTVTAALAVALSPRGLDDPTEIDQLRQLVREAPGGIATMPGLKLTVRSQDIEGLQPRQIRLNLFRPLAERFYRAGGQGVMGSAEGSQIQGEVGSVFGVLGFFTAQTHQQLQQIAGVLAIASLLLLLPLLYFSTGFGRLGSPGLVLVLATLPGALLSAGASSAFQGSPAAPSTPPTDLPAMVALAASSALPPLVRIVADNYRLWLQIGLGLTAVAVIADLALRVAGAVATRGPGQLTPGSQPSTPPH